MAKEVLCSYRMVRCDLCLVKIDPSPAHGGESVRPYPDRPRVDCVMGRSEHKYRPVSCTLYFDWFC